MKQKYDYCFYIVDILFSFKRGYLLQFAERYVPSHHESEYRPPKGRAVGNVPTSPKNFERSRSKTFKTDSYKNDYVNYSPREHSRSPLHRDHRITHSPITGA